MVAESRSVHIEHPSPGRGGGARPLLARLAAPAAACAIIAAGRSSYE